VAELKGLNWRPHLNPFGGSWNFDTEVQYFELSWWLFFGAVSRAKGPITQLECCCLAKTTVRNTTSFSNKLVH